MSLFSELVKAFLPGSDGYVFMWVLALIAIAAIVLMIERWLDISKRTNVDAEAFTEHCKKLLREQKFDEAYSLCLSAGRRALPRIFGAGIKRAEERRESIINAMEEESLHMIPILEKRVDFIMMFGNVSTLIGLMGTIFGLILSFAAVARPDVDPIEKSSLLASGISTAMNTTLLGLMISVPCVMIFSMLKEKVDAAAQEIDRYSAAILKELLPDQSVKKDYRVTGKRIKEEVDTEPNIAPMMNLMVILIPLLLSSAEFVKIGAIELKLPENAGGGGGGGSNQLNNAKLDLGIVVTSEGFNLFHYFKKDDEKEITTEGDKKQTDIPKVKGEYDFSGLNKALADVKKKALFDIVKTVNSGVPKDATLLQLYKFVEKTDLSENTTFEDHVDVKIVAEEKIKYEIIVAVMDAARGTKTPNGKVTMFPNVSLAGGIVH